MRTQPRSLEEMHRRITAYEIVAVQGEKHIRLGFTARPNKRSLLDAARSQGGLLCSMLSKAEQEAIPTYTKAGGWRFGSLSVRLSGKTERDCALETT